MATRRCKIQLQDGESQEVSFPGSVESVIGILDEVRWTITASNQQTRIVFVIEEINWPKTDLKFEDQNPNQVAIRHEGNVFPIFPEYNSHVIKSGIFLSGTHSIRMEMDMPIIAELPSIPSFRMKFTAYTVQEIFRCKLSTTSCDMESTLHWKRKSDGYVYKGSTTTDEGALTVHLPKGTQLAGKGYASFGYVFDYQGIMGTSGGQSKDEEGRVTVECPGRRNFGISEDGVTQLVVDCDVDDLSITFTAHGSLRLVIADVDLHDAKISMNAGDPEPSSDSSALPVIAGISVFIGLVVVSVLLIAIFRRKRSQVAEKSQERNSKPTLDKGHDNTGFQLGNIRTIEDPDEGTYHYPSFPLSPPPKDGDTIYQEIEKKDKKGHSPSPNAKDNREVGKNAYDLLELPKEGSLDSNKKVSRSTEKLPVSGSPMLSRCMSRGMGYETLDGTSEPTSSKDTVPPFTKDKGVSEKETQRPKPSPGECDYLEILSSEEIESLKLQDKNGQPVLAHQDLYQHLKRHDIPFHASGQGQAAKDVSSEDPGVSEENYGKLDIAIDNHPPPPDYFVIEANTDC
ncbi:uncharacterized protein LOC135157356 [Lytechinus pictus]|uniref:uncharacterized protein LOC135157356 n=1 Tax=Lytechinus pictus TaxID=7653 RepID=UPI0030B9E1D4